MAKAPKKNPASSTDRLIENRKARFEYHIHEEVECGIILKGGEVKSVRAGAVSLTEGWVKAIASPPSLLLYGVNIAEYGPSGPIQGGVGAAQHKPTRPRALLAHKREMIKLARQSEEKGLTIVPLKMYFKNGFAKVLIAVAKGKASHDKRDTIKKRESERDIRRATTRRA